MKRLAYTAVTSSGLAYEIRFPLHQETRSQEAVADMMSAILETVSVKLADHATVSDGDVLQALAMTMAIRARLVDATPAVSLRLMHGLIDQAFAAALNADEFAAGRA